MEANSLVNSLKVDIITSVRLESVLSTIIPSGKKLRGKAGANIKVTKIIYTIRAGDDKRLDKLGVLRVYDINKLIEIPVTGILGRWKNSHIGTTIFRKDDKWQIEGNNITPIPVIKNSSVSLIKRLIFKSKSVNFFEKIFNRRIAEDNFLKNA